MDSALERAGWDSTATAALLATATSIKIGVTKFGGYMIYNPNATVAYVQVFDQLVGSVVMGTTVPDLIFPIPATGAANLELVNGRLMKLGIVIAATTTPTGLTAMGAAITTNIFYK